MNFELCIFDLDGTLVDTRADLTASVNEMLAHYGLPAKSVDEVTGYVGDGVTVLVERCLGDHPADQGEAAAIFRESYMQHLLDTTKPYPGVEEMLGHLRSNRRALLTNKPFDPAKKILDCLGLTKYFRLIVGGDTLSERKPSPHGVYFILDQMRCSPDRALMIGDGPNDILTAKNAGIRSVYVTYGFTAMHELNGEMPDFIIDSPSELVKIC